MKLRIICAAILAAALSGCAFFQKNTTIDGLEVRGNQPLSVAYEYCPPDNACEKPSEATFPTLYSEFVKAKKDAYDNRNTDTASTYLLGYVNAGIALSNKACADWFSYHNREAERVDHNQGLANLVGNAVTAGMGIAEANANAMGYVGLILGGLNQGYEVFKEDFLLTGAIWKLEKGVREGRLQAAENLRSNATGSDPYTYFEVQDALLAYHNSCSRLQLIAFVESSIDFARYQPPEGPSVGDQARLFQLGRDIYQAVRGTEGVYTERRLRELYVIFTAPSTKQAQTLLQRSYLSDVKERVDALMAGDDAQKERAVRFYDLLDEVGALLGLDAEIQETEKQIAESDEEIADAEEDLAQATRAQEEGIAPSQLFQSLTSGAEDETIEDLIDRFRTRLEELQSERDRIATMQSVGEAGRRAVTLEAVPR